MASPEQHDRGWLVGLGLFVVAVSAYINWHAFSQYREGLFSEELSEILFFILFFTLVLPGVGVCSIIAAYSPAFRRIIFDDEYLEKHQPVIECKQCFYDLRGSVLAGSTRCPECGEEIGSKQASQIRKLHRYMKRKQRRFKDSGER